MKAESTLQEEKDLLLSKDREVMLIGCTHVSLCDDRHINNQNNDHGSEAQESRMAKSKT
jgi:hypothetical protein